MLALTVAGYCVTAVGSHLVPTNERNDGAWGFVLGVDYPQFYAGARMVAEGRSAEVYDVGAFRAELLEGLHRERTKLLPLYPPPILVAFAPLGVLPYRASVAVYAALAATLLWAGAQLHRRIAPVASAADARTAGLAYFALWPVAATLLVGHPSPVLGLIAPGAALALRAGRPLAAGVLLGLLAYKPQLCAAAGLALLGAGRWRLLAGFALGAGALCAATLPVVGWEAWQGWLDQAMQFGQRADRLMRYPGRMYNLRAALALPFPVEMWPMLRGPSLLLSAGVLVMGGRILRPLGPETTLRLGAFCCAIVLGTPHLYEYDAILLALPAAALAEAAFRPEFGHLRQQLLGLLLGLLLIFPLHMASTQLRVPLVQPMVGVLMCVCWRLARALACSSTSPPRPRVDANG